MEGMNPEEPKNEQQSEQKSKSGNFIAILGIIALIYFAIMIAGGSKDDYTADDLLDAQIKRSTGQKISREDEIMFKGYDSWKRDQDKYED